MESSSSSSSVKYSRSSSPGGNRMSSRNQSVVSIISSGCVVDGCNADLSLCRDYHRRHKVCETHSKMAKVTIGGREQRFCQQCSRFHSLVEFDQAKRSCRKRLDGHNRRRRKPQPSSPHHLSRNNNNNNNNDSSSGGGLGLVFSSSQQASAPQNILPSSSNNNNGDHHHHHHHMLLLYNNNQQHMNDNYSSPFPVPQQHSYKGRGVNQLIDHTNYSQQHDQLLLLLHDHNKMFSSSSSLDINNNNSNGLINQDVVVRAPSLLSSASATPSPAPGIVTREPQSPHDHLFLLSDPHHYHNMQYMPQHSSSTSAINPFPQQTTSNNNASITNPPHFFSDIPPPTSTRTFMWE